MLSSARHRVEQAFGIRIPCVGGRWSNIALHRAKIKANRLANPAVVVQSVTLAILIAVATACATSPADSFDRTAARLGLTVGEIQGAEYRLRRYDDPTAAPVSAPAGTRRLHVYLDGDGRPFVRPWQVAHDPTPQDPLVLHLLLADPQRAVYLGRPCYHGLHQGCDPRLWTLARYSEAIINAMSDAIVSLAAEHTASEIVLIGYSGGGTLATLIAERLPIVTAVVTLAANLDIDAWTRWHGFTPLADSLNPALLANSRPDLRQLHFSGDRDGNTPPELQSALAARLPSARFQIIEAFDHRCCWAEYWPALLAEIETWLASNR